MSVSELNLSSPTGSAARRAVVVDFMRDVDQRPLCGHDIESFRASMGLSRMEFSLAMALVPGHYQKTVSDQHPLSLDREILLRLYQLSPGPSAWQNWSPQEAFEEFYGPLLRSFVLPVHQAKARVMLYRRFTAIMGRSVARSFSWFQGNQGHSLPVRRVLGKLIELASPREVLEAIAAQAYAVRGQDLELIAPLPTLESVSRVRRGRSPKLRLTSPRGELS